MSQGGSNSSSRVDRNDNDSLISSRNVSSTKTTTKSTGMDDRHNQRVRSIPNSNSSDIRTILSRNGIIRKLRTVNTKLLKRAFVPFGAVTTTLLLTGFDRAYAATSKNIDTYKGDTDWSQLFHLPETIKDGVGNVKEGITGISDQVNEIISTISSVIDWFKDFNPLEFTSHMLSSTYEILSYIILKTPMWIFDNVWFENTCYLFSIFSIGVVSVLMIVNGIKKKFQIHTKKKATDFKDIAKRWFIAAGLSSLIPTLFQKAFSLLNLASDKIISLGGTSVYNIASGLTGLSAGATAFTIFFFNLVLFAVTIPILLQNGKRFFDLMCLGVASPLAFAAWVFDDHKHYLTTWWSNVKRLSLVQIVYAFFFLIMGLFIFGTPLSVSASGYDLLVKLSVIIGGYYRMANPPTFVKRHLYNDTETMKDKVKKYKKTTRGLVGNIKSLGTPVSTVMSVGSFLSKSPFDKGTVTKPMSRMARYHGK